MLFDDVPQLGRFFHNTTGHLPALKQVIWSNSGLLGRPVSMLTFWVNSALTPDNIFAWKLTNLMIHMLAGLFVGLLAMELFTVASRNPGIEPRYIGAFVGILWLLHPLQVSTVLYTVQRMTELAALFAFAGLYAFVRMRRHGQEATLRQTIWGLGILSVATILATFSKENGLLLPFLALAVELLLFGGAGTAGAARAIKYYFGGLCVLTILASVLLLTLHPHFITGGYAFRDFTLQQRLLTEPRILFEYLSMILWPAPEKMGFFHDDVVISTGLLHPVTTLLSLLGLIALVISVWIARRRFPLYALGVAIFLIGQSMESSFIALEPMFEHRNYLPGFGILLGVTDLGAWIVAKRAHVVPNVLSGLVISSLIIALAARVTHWTTSTNFYRNAVAAHPESDGAIAGLAQEYLDTGNPDQALKTLASHDDFGVQLQRAYIECRMNGSLSEIQVDELARQPMGHLSSYPVTGLTMLGAAGIQNQCRIPDAAYSRLIDRAAQLDTTGHDLRYMLYIYSGYYHQRLQQLESAVAAMQAAHRMSPDTPVPLILSARWYLEAGDPAQAGIQLDQALSIDHQYHAGFADDITQLRKQIEETAGKSPRRPRVE